MCSLTVFNILKPALLIQVSLDIGLNDDLVTWFLMSNLVNLNASRLWGIHTGEGQMVIPKQPHFVSNDVYAEIQATLAGRMVSQLVNYTNRTQNMIQYHHYGILKRLPTDDTC